MAQTENSSLPNTDIPLGSLTPGAKGIIKQIKASETQSTDIAGDALADRLREIGFAEDLPFEVMQHSPFGGDPIAVSVGGMTVAIRRADANLILVETL